MDRWLTYSRERVIPNRKRLLTRNKEFTDLKDLPDEQNKDKFKPNEPVSLSRIIKIKALTTEKHIHFFDRLSHRNCQISRVSTALTLQTKTWPVRVKTLA